MTKKAFAYSFMLAGLISVYSIPEVHNRCRGFLPENDLNIPVSEFAEEGITERQFEEVLDRVEEIYRPIIAAKGGRLQIVRNWDSGTVNAYAQRIGSTYRISMFGGLARHHQVTPDGFALVACHEIGHHLGGFPRKGDSWASNEGQSDYFGVAKCIRKIYEEGENWELAGRDDVDPLVEESCSTVFEGEEQQDLCIHSSKAGFSLASLLGELINDAREARDLPPLKMPEFGTPDPNVVATTDHSHPAAQCRLDTYFQGSLCDKSEMEDFDQNDPNPGACTRQADYEQGIRPLCWYKPPAGDGAQLFAQAKQTSRIGKISLPTLKEIVW